MPKMLLHPMSTVGEVDADTLPERVRQIVHKMRVAGEMLTNAVVIESDAKTTAQLLEAAMVSARAVIDQALTQIGGDNGDR